MLNGLNPEVEEIELVIFYSLLMSNKEWQWCITTSRRFKCVIQKWATPLDTLASGLGFIPWGIDFGSRRIPPNKC